MWRSFFLGLGITCVIFGAGCTVVDKVVLARKAPPPAAATGLEPEPSQPTKIREVTIPDWAPWSLMAGGAVVILYSFHLPTRFSSD